MLTLFRWVGIPHAACQPITTLARLYYSSKPRKVWVTELEAEGMSEEDRLAPCLRTLDQAEKALKLGRLDEVSSGIETTGAIPLLTFLVALPRLLSAQH